MRINFPNNGLFFRYFFGPTDLSDIYRDFGTPDISIATDISDLTEWHPDSPHLIPLHKAMCSYEGGV